MLDKLYTFPNLMRLTTTPGPRWRIGLPGDDMTVRPSSRHAAHFSAFLLFDLKRPFTYYDII